MTTYAALIADVRAYVAETDNGAAHVERWQRVLKGLGETDAEFADLTPMTAVEAQVMADTYWSVRRDPVVTALTALKAAPPPAVQPTVSIAGGASVTEGGDVSFTVTASPAPAADLPVTVTVSETGSFASGGESSLLGQGGRGFQAGKEAVTAPLGNSSRPGRPVCSSLWRRGS